MCSSLEIATKCIKKCETLILEILKLITHTQSDITSISFPNDNDIQLIQVRQNIFSVIKTLK